MLTELTNALRDALAGAAGLAAVHLAAGPGPFESAQLPAATLTLADLRRGGGDDPDGLAQVRYELTLWRRDASGQANAAALHVLSDAAVAALLADPTQGGLAVPGPGGRATEILSVQPGRRQAPPLGSLDVQVACWIIPPDGLTPLPAGQQVELDGAALLASGPHTLTVGDWQRRRAERQFAGLDGTVSIDLGASHRSLTLAGRLVADSRAELLAQIQAVEDLNDALPHVLAGPDGRTFYNVRVGGIEWGRVFSPAADAVSCVGYRIELAQLAT